MQGQYIELERLSDIELVDLFKNGKDEPRLLAALNEELKARDSDVAVELHTAVSAARLRLRKRAAVVSSPPGAISKPPGQKSPPPTGPVRSWLGAFFAARGLKLPDGRLLCRYRMNDAEYAEAKVILRRLAGDGRLDQPDDRSGALFVAYCAEWFRRESASTFLRWDDPAPDLFPRVPYASKKKLAIRGLNAWRRQLRLINGNREFLLTVALEGGVPVKVLRDGAKGWLKDYLRAVMHRLVTLGVSAPEDVLLVADEEGWRIRKSYRHEDFIHICAELAERLLHWRSVAEREAGPSGSAQALRNTQLLDAKHPLWREELPVYVGKDDEIVVEGLLAGLVDEKLGGLSTEGVGAKRFLIQRAGCWKPALQVLADGEIPAAKVPDLTTSLGRARAVPTGELSNHLAGDFAVFEPPVGVQRRWRVRPSNRLTRLMPGFPLEAKVTVTLTSSGVPHNWTWPGGEALRSELLVFRDDDGATQNERLLRFLRAGSVASSAKKLYALCPESWSVEAKDGETTLSEDVLPGIGRKLVTISGAAYFRSADPDASRFLVETNAEEREEELELARIHNLVLTDERCDLISSPSTPAIRGKGGKTRPLRGGELSVRHRGGRWEPVIGQLGGAGVVELSWRDPMAGIQIEKQLLALVPIGASLKGRLVDAQSGEIEALGLPGWTIVVPGSECSAEQVTPGRLAVRFSGRPLYRLTVRLVPPQGEGFDVSVSLVGREGCIALADGKVLRPGSVTDLRSLRGAVATSPRPIWLQLMLKGDRSGGFRPKVDGELPLGTLRSGIQEMLGASAHQDDMVEVEFLGDTRPPIRISRYGEHTLSFDAEKVRWSPGASETNLQLVARMVLDPRREHALERETDGVWRLPERCANVCLVYLRDGPDVVSRPLPANVAQAAGAPAEGLLRALANPDFGTRQAAIVAALEAIGAGQGAAADLRWLLDAATNLNGLPPSALDGLARLPQCPSALVRLLLAATDEERHLVWSLQNELPFLWLALPIVSWREAIGADMESLITTLEAHLGREQAARLAMDRLYSLAANLSSIEPALAMVLREAGVPAEPLAGQLSLVELMSRHVAGSAEGAEHGRNQIASHLSSLSLKTPPAILSMTHEEHAGLFAPLVLAAGAQSRLKLNRELMLLSRRILREDPHYVAAAFPHFLSFYR
ncbi:STY4851/ECs_5259 family protein [Mesorhizobium sp. LHD-90]|uniref:STY4851/ECs_5259 family protein n=1 Tax=Mesorhizobium sp. LHD-90 TaxID=3071414 RepID=UPI0027E09969|nr:STY4851/ECs_5259 family protein [Mesorhizobium sp. LHD-90]MDQ6436651.1 STY4851/ECs_5259 family protein [Mesorhizobium sp. LHD-90]